MSTKLTRPTPLLGAHVSIAGGLELAPERGARIGANVIQIFTKQVNRWAERDIGRPTASAFRSAIGNHVPPPSGPPGAGRY